MDDVIVSSVVSGGGNGAGWCIVGGGCGHPATPHLLIFLLCRFTCLPLLTLKNQQTPTDSSTIRVDVGMKSLNHRGRQPTAGMSLSSDRVADVPASFQQLHFRLIPVYQRLFPDDGHFPAARHG